MKSAAEKDATPLFDVVASSAEIVTVPPVAEVSMASPPAKVRVWLDAIAVPLSDDAVNMT